MINTLELEPNLQKQVDAGSSGTDILHGELKWLMLQAEEQMEMAREQGHEPDLTYFEGQLDAFTHVYQLTYALAFALEERAQKNG
jgi:hypothetical protein